MARSLCIVSAADVAKKYGGGGHWNAAGFSMPRGWEGGER